MTTYTYDPSGTPTVSGTANDWPFLINGIEQELTDPQPYYYSGSGQFYSPQLVRSLSEAGRDRQQRYGRWAIGASSTSDPAAKETGVSDTGTLDS